MNEILKIQNITKEYHIYQNNFDRIKEVFFGKKLHKNFLANDDITFSLQEGETLGIIGVNGAGKSTLLKIISGVTAPTCGQVIKKGRVTALLELGTGFNPELSGKENIYLNGTLIGMSEKEIDKKLDAIIAFSELQEYIENPVKMYSSGMAMRLAFSIAIFSDPQVLIVDEALSVGDAHFSQKCINALKEKKTQNMSIIYVSHDLNSLKILCDRLILLSKGKILEEGSPEDVINTYNLQIAQLNQDIKQDKNNSFGNFDAKITDVSIQGNFSQSATIATNEKTTIAINFFANKDVKDLAVGIMIRDKFAQDIFGTNTNLQDIQLEVQKNCHYKIFFQFHMDIAPGYYTLTVALHEGENHINACSHWIDNAAKFEVISGTSSSFVGICNLKPTIQVQRLH